MDTNYLLNEILKWQRLQGLNVLKSIIPSLLDTKEKMEVYELTDGSKSVKEISSKAKVATGTISNWWSKWLAGGILYKDGTRYIKLVSLEEVSFKKEGDEK